MSNVVILSLSGKKGSGKNTIAEFISTWLAKHFLIHVSDTSHGDIKEYAFANLIKEFCINVLGLTPEQCYGTDEEKNTPTKYSWEEAPIGWPIPHGGAMRAGVGNMTGREVMQIFGTDCVRNWFGNVWADATLRCIKKDNPSVAIVNDNRFPNEVESILAYPRGHVIRLTRSPFGSDSHPSETALDDYDWGSKERCHVLDNATMTIEQQNEHVTSILKQIFRKGD